MHQNMHRIINPRQQRIQRVINQLLKVISRVIFIHLQHQTLHKIHHIICILQLRQSRRQHHREQIDQSMIISS